MNKMDKSPEEQLRIRAEMQIKEKAASPSSRVDLQRIVHELEVHQIELEMQNEELRSVRSNLESLLDQYTELYDFAPVGYFTLDDKGIILKANLTMATLLGMERSSLPNRPFGIFVLPDHRLVFNAFLKKVFESRSRENCELAMQKDNMEPFFVRLEAMAIDPATQCRMALIDVTEKTKNERKLRESEKLFHSLFETMTQGIVFLDKDHRIMSINPAAARILCLRADEIEGKTWPFQGWRMIRENGTEFPRDEQPSEMAFRTNTTIKNEVAGVISPASSGTIWIRINALPQHSFSEAGPCQVILIIEDITHLKRMSSYNMLTTREKQVFSLLAKGHSRQIMAHILGIKPKTVDKHKENIMDKLSIFDLEGIMLFAKLIGVLKS